MIINIFLYCFLNFDRQYFFVIIKDKPMQLWDLKNVTVLREMPPSFPTVTVLVSSISSIKLQC